MGENDQDDPIGLTIQEPLRQAWQPEGDASDNPRPPSGTAALPRTTAAAVEVLRRQLLDIGKRNRLINTPLKSTRAKQLIVVDEVSDEVFRILVSDRKKMSFLPIPEAKTSDDTDGESENDDEEIYLPPEDDDVDEGGIAARHTDTRLQTALGREKLQKRLLGLFNDARVLEEEQGVSVLYLALGFLHWYEADSSDVERFAPLLILPVDLKRTSAKGRFQLEFREQDLEINLSLKAMLEADFQLKLPDLPDSEDWRPSEYFDQVRECISDKTRWSVAADEMVLGFYSFAKFLMWRDLDATVWPDGTGLAGNGLIDKLLVDGFEGGKGLFSGEEKLDEVFSDPRALGHIMDADASQTQVIAAASQGHNLVVQGPPGTGKSQTIANMIATAARDGKTVLFVAEKMAALSVVHDRLVQCGLGDLCLELHSRKANKRSVLEELKRTLDAGRPSAANDANFQHVRELRDKLNTMSTLVHQRDEISGQTPFLVMGWLAKLREDGVPLPDFKLPASADWTLDQRNEVAESVAQLADLTRKHGREIEHPWRGASKRLTPMERQRLAGLIAQLIVALDTVLSAYSDAAKIASGAETATPESINSVVLQLKAFESMPKEVREYAANPAVIDQLPRALALAEKVASTQDTSHRLAGVVIPQAFDMDWSEVRTSIAVKGSSIFRFLDRRYREAIAKLRSVCKDVMPSQTEARLELLDRLLDRNSQVASIRREGTFGEALFRAHWRFEETEVERPLDAMRWMSDEVSRHGSATRVAEITANYPTDAEPHAARAQLSQAYNGWKLLWGEAANVLGLDLPVAFDLPDADEPALAAISARLEEWSQRIGELEDWGRLSAIAENVTELGANEVRVQVSAGSLTPEHAEGCLMFAWAEALWGRLCTEMPALLTLNGDDRTRVAEAFRTADGQLKVLAAQELAHIHHQRIPRGSSGRMGVVRSEIARKRGHMPLRKLMDQAGEAVLQIKPVFLMSPLSVAQYLKPGRLAFDLLVIDEASQVRPEDAIGAIARAGQIVVVGDRKQLPPTSFFDRQIQGTANDEDETAEDADDPLGMAIAQQVGDMESILTLCDARSMPGDVLRWHYRSRHPSLIEVSNHAFYDDRLIYPPSPDHEGSKSGLSLTHVEGVYDRGRTRQNPLEAEIVASAILAHAREFPGKSLGVVTLSIAQRDAILNKLEFLRASNPELEAFCNEGNRERFFVKSLENVQGDERDFIFISIGYGRDTSGYMSQSFGPVSSDGGERRLNVLFTRAKERCRVFSSITHRDIRGDAARNEGPRALQRFLKYAETGDLDLPVITGGDMDNPFEESVAAALIRSGFSVEAQVGSAGFRIDLAIYDPGRPGQFLLGIECDGARYHSSRWARERDRLRQTVLEDKGWVIHRIWSTDWFQNPDGEIQKVLAVIDRCRSADSGGVQMRKKHANPVRIERDPVLIEDSLGTPTYLEANFPISEKSHTDLHEAKPGRLREYIEQIVQIEGPIHTDEIGRRLSRLWGYQRAGQRIQNIVAIEAKALIRLGRVSDSQFCEVGFLDRAVPSEPVLVRDRAAVASATLRKPEMLPPKELQAGVLGAIEESIALSFDDCAVDVARRLGFKSTSAEFKDRMRMVVKAMLRDGLIERDGDEIRFAAVKP